MAGLHIKKTEALFLLIAVCALAAMLTHGPVPQDPAYHDFADQRTLLGIPHFSNVLSNLPYLAAGFAGLCVIYRYPLRGGLQSLHIHYLLFFAGIALVAIGSAWYHLDPSNSRLFWDRLPITLAFMAFTAVIIGEYYTPRLGRQLLWPLVITGLLSVIYWYWTEQSGNGDLRPYAIVQFLPMVILPLILLFRRPRYTPVAYLWWMMGLYLLAKIAELYDVEIYALTGTISGHTLKHLFSATAPLFFILALLQRRPN